MRKKILIISAVFPPEQVTSAFLNYDLAHELAKEYEVTVLRPYPTRPIGTTFESAKVEDKSFMIILIESYTHPQSELLGRFCESIDFGRKSAAYIKANHKEIDFVYNDGWQLFGLNIVAKACKRYGIPYMVPIQDIYPECLFTNRNYPGILKACINGVLMPIDKYYQKHATCVRTISDEMRDYLAETRGVAQENYLVVNNWQNDADFLKEYPKRKEDGKIIYAYVGSINEHANVDLMIKAFAEAAIPNSEFKIYGGGNKKDECVQLVQQLGLTNVSFDFVSRDQIAYVQSQVDVLILALPTGNGNLCLPSKLTSYMLSGKPILASVDEDSSTKRILSCSGAGYAVKPDSLDSLKEGFKYFAGLNKEKLNEMGASSLQYAKEHLTREINLKLVVDRIKNHTILAEEKQMHGFRARLDYVLKHNYFINNTFRSSVSAFMRAWGCFVPIDEKMIIFSGHTRKYNDSPRAIYEHMIAHPEYKDYKYVWALEDPEHVDVPGPAIKIKADTPEYFKYTLKAKYWITCVNIERSLQYKKKKCVYLNTWHGVAFNCVGNAAGGRNDFDFSHINLFCYESDYQKEIFKRDMNVREDALIPSGLPRNDSLYHVTKDEVIAIKKKLGLPLDKKILMYAPTWRDSYDKGASYAIKPPMDLKKWEEKLKDEYVLLFRTHAYTTKLLGVEFDDFCLDYTSYPVINDLFKVADILISDYSACIADYSILERPVICFAYDYEDYKSTRGLYIDFAKDMPNGILETEDKVIDHILTMDYQKECEKTRDMIKNRFTYLGGHATEMCVEKMFKK